ncbi:MAG: hypothetical protein V9E88_16730 [Ferruginibacter sp.]
MMKSVTWVFPFPFQKPFSNETPIASIDQSFHTVRSHAAIFV